MRKSAFVFVAMMSWAAGADAQEHNSFALGFGVTQRVASQDHAHGDLGYGLKWRFGHEDTGWGWHYGLNWYATNLDRRINGRDVRFGELKVRPFLGGYGYTYRINEKWSVTGDVIGGFAFSSMEVTPQANDALHLTSDLVRVDTGATPVVKPEVSAWYDLTRKFGLNVGIGYIIARPRITVVTAAGRDSERFRADTFTLNTGIVYRIF